MPSNGPLPAGVRDSASSIEEALLFAVIVGLPLQYVLGTFRGVSVIALLIGLIGAVSFVRNPANLLRSFATPPLMIGFMLIGYGFASESVRLTTSFDFVTRVAKMLIGAAFVCSICRSRRQYMVIKWAILVMGGWLGAYLILTKYGLVSGGAATEFSHANALRANVFSGASLGNNLNELAFLAALGAVTTLGCAVSARSSSAMILLGAAAAAEFLACSLPLSRDGIIAAAVGSLYVLFHSRRKLGRRVAIGLAGALAVAALLPSAVLARMVVTSQGVGSGSDPRTQIYRAAFDALPRYIWLGVGNGTYEDSWGNQNGFVRGGVLVGAHDAFFQVAIFWGLPGLILLIFLLVTLWRTRAKIRRLLTDSQVDLLVDGLLVVFLVRIFFTHVLYDSAFAVIIGLVSAGWMKTSVAVGARPRRTAEARGPSTPRVAAAGRPSEQCAATPADEGSVACE